MFFVYVFVAAALHHDKSKNFLGQRSMFEEKRVGMISGLLNKWLPFMFRFFSIPKFNMPPKKKAKTLEGQ